MRDTSTSFADPLFSDNHLTVVRWILAFMVFTGHAAIAVTGHGFMQIHGWEASYVGVNGFFILSGLLISKSLDTGQSKANYIAARGLRIYPALILVLITYAIWIGPTFTVPREPAIEGWEFWFYGLRVLCLGDTEQLPGEIFTHLKDPDFNGALWTIRWEIIAYMFSALVIWTGLMRTARAAIMVCGTLTLAYLIVPHLTERAGVVSFLRLMSAFSLGMVLWKIPQLRAVKIWHLAGLFAVFLLLGGSAIGELTLNFTLAAAILLFGLPRTANPMLVRLPDFSYGIYLWHFPILQIILERNPSLNSFSLFVLTLPIALAIAAASWYLVEKPSLKLKPLLADAIRKIFALMQPRQPA